MPSYVKRFIDKEKLRAYRNKDRNRNYRIGAVGCYPHEWNQFEEIMVLEHKTTDRELAKEINHSVIAIQKRRWLLKKIMNSKS